MHDLVIKNALILDGDGGDPFIGALAVGNGRVAALGPGDPGAAREVIDADGLALAPGIIDGHTHYDAQITWDPYCDPSPALGVTTVVIGNCGFTIAPCRPADRGLMMRHLTRVEGMSWEALEQGTRWTFESFPEYLDALAAQGVGPNVAGFVGHSAVRTYVMGEDASSRTATDDEIAAMGALVAEAMRAGAVGFSSSTHEQHVGDAGVPMPARLADDREFRALSNAMAESGRGLLMVLKGSKVSIPFLESLSAETGRPMLVSSMRHHPDRPDAVFQDLAQLRAARERGNRLYGLCACLPMTMDFSLANPYPFEAYEAWRPATMAKGEALRAIFADAGFRARMKAELAANTSMRIFRGDWGIIKVGEALRPENRRFEGRSVKEIAAEQGKDALDTFLDLGLSEDLGMMFTTEFYNADVEAVGRIISDHDAYIGLSDAGAHMTFLCDAGFGLDLLGRWVRDLGVMSLPEAVRKLTSQGADLFGIQGRGRLRPGYAADLMLFDPATVAMGRNTRLFDLPGGATRLRASAHGLHGVWVNGVRMADENGPVARESWPGEVIRQFGA